MAEIGRKFAQALLSMNKLSREEGYMILLSYSFFPKNFFIFIKLTNLLGCLI